jgi:hypothetical protein
LRLQPWVAIPLTSAVPAAALPVDLQFRPCQSACVWFPKGSALPGGRQKVANEMHSGLRVRIGLFPFLVLIRG